MADDPPEAALRLFVEASPRVVALAGGTTPRRFYERLATLRYPWDQVHVVPTDERCVPPGHEDSNFRMLDRALLSRIPATVHRLAGETCDPALHDREVRDLLRRAPLDLALLGLGEDGHTASLFPGHPALAEAERAVVRVDGQGHPRLTLTLPVLSSARVALFLVTGSAKREALRCLLAGEDLPATRVEAGRVVVVADPKAAPDAP